MKLELQSKDLDISKCVSNVGGNRFELILIAATRAREIASQRLFQVKNNTSLKFPVKTVTAALDEVEKGKIGREYLDKLHKKHK